MFAKFIIRIARFIPHAILHVAISRNVLKALDEAFIEFLTLLRLSIGPHHPIAPIVVVVLVIVLDLVEGGHGIHALIRDLAKLWREFE